jgi:hypothetical protein
MGGGTVKEKFSTNLSDAQRERLGILGEEMGEALQAVGKILRHGYDSWNPTVVGSRVNREDLSRELGHVRYAIQMLINAEDVTNDAIVFSELEKERTIKRWLHFQ